MMVRGVLQGREGDAQCVVRMCEGPEADAHEGGGSGSVMGGEMIRGRGARLRVLGAGLPKKDKVCGVAV